MDIEHEYYYSDSFFAHTSIQYDHQPGAGDAGHGDGCFQYMGQRCEILGQRERGS